MDRLHAALEPRVAWSHQPARVATDSDFQGAFQQPADPATAVTVGQRFSAGREVDAIAAHEVGPIGIERDRMLENHSNDGGSALRF